MDFEIKEHDFTKELNITLDSMNDEGHMKQVEYLHNKVHTGDLFTVSKNFKGVVDNGYARLRIKSGSKGVCFTWSFTTEGKCYLNTYAGTTYSNDGTVQAIFNRKSVLGKVATCQIFHTPTVNVLGSMRGDDLIGAGGNANIQAGGTGAQGIETCLPPNSAIFLQAKK